MITLHDGPLAGQVLQTWHYTSEKPARAVLSKSRSRRGAERGGSPRRLFEGAPIGAHWAVIWACAPAGPLDSPYPTVGRYHRYAWRDGQWRYEPHPLAPPALLDWSDHCAACGVQVRECGHRRRSG